MNVSFLDDGTTTLLRFVVRKFLSREIRTIRTLRGGYNNRVMRISLNDGNDIVAKISSPGGSGERDRCACEYRSLRFLWEHGIRTIPRPLGVDRAARVALYRFVEGSKPKAGTIGDRDILQATDFIRRLDRLRPSAIHARLPVAAEASLRPRDFVDRVEGRLAHLEKIRGARAATHRCRRYVRDDVRPFFEKVRRWFFRSAEAWGIDPGQPLRRRERFLNPSDFGFHNTLQTRDGRLCFLDFEYFGWDDPAKMIADFLHQPEVPLTISQKEVFFREAVKRVSTKICLERRVVLAYPLQGIKWSLILLNEFLKGPIDRRRFAGSSRGGDETLERQLRKSQTLFRNVAKEFDERMFPYSLPA